MTIKRSVRVRNAIATAVTSTIVLPASVVLLAGSVPASTTDPDPGTVVAIIAVVAANYMAAAAAGAQELRYALSGTVTAAATITHYRIVGGDGVVDEQGSVTLVGGGGDCEIAAASLDAVVGQPVRLSLRTLTGV